MKNWVKWILLAVVRPLVAMWLMVEGAPNVVRAIGSAAATVIRAIKDEGGESKTRRSTTLRSTTLSGKSATEGRNSRASREKGE